MKKRMYLKTYLWIALVFGIFSLLDSFLTLFDVTNNMWVGMLMTTSFVFFLFNILSLIIFRQKEVNKIFFLLPLYHILTYVTFFAISFGLLLLRIMVDWLWIVMVTIGLASSVFEVLFALYLIRRLKIIESGPVTTFETAHWAPPKSS